MVLLGSLLNALFIIIGALVGRIFKNIPESMQQTVLSIIGLVVALLGIQMGLESTNFILLIVSLIIGAVIGEWLDLEGKFNRFGQWIESLFGKRAQKGTIAEGLLLQRSFLLLAQWEFSVLLIAACAMITISSSLKGLSMDLCRLY